MESKEGGSYCEQERINTCFNSHIEIWLRRIDSSIYVPSLPPPPSGSKMIHPLEQVYFWNVNARSYLESN